MREFFGWAGFFAATACALGIVSSLDEIPFQDVADWAHQGWALNLCLSGDARCASFAIKPYPVPNTTATALFAVLFFFAEPRLAAGIVVGLALGLWALAAWRLAAAADRLSRGYWATLLFGIFGLSTPFWLGYLNFQIGTALLAIAVLRVRDNAAGMPEIALWALLLFFTHALPFGAFALFAGWMALMPGRRRRSLLGLAPAALLAVWYAVARALEERHVAAAVLAEGIDSPLPSFVWKIVALFAQGPGRLLVVGHTPLRAFDDAARFALDAAGAAVSAFAIVAVAHGVRAAGNGTSRVFLVPGLAMFVAFLLAPPVNFFGLINPGERFLLLGLLLVLPFARLPSAAAATVATLALALHAVSAAQLLRFDAAIAEGRHLAAFRTQDYTPYAIPLAGRQFAIEALERREVLPIERNYATGIFQASPL